jgi:hypothetical protein
MVSDFPLFLLITFFYLRPLIASHFTPGMLDFKPAVKTRKSFLGIRLPLPAHHPLKGGKITTIFLPGNSFNFR